LVFSNLRSGAVTVKSTEVAGDPMVVCIVVTPLVVLGCTPNVVDVTVTVTVQLLLAGIEIPLKVSAVVAFAKLLLAAPVHVPPALWAPLIDILLKVSEKPAPVKILALGLESVNVMVEVPPVTMVAGLKAFEMVAGPSTVKFAVFDAVPIAVCAVVTPLVVFGFTPSVLDVTTTVTVQLLLAGIVIPDRLRLVAPSKRLLLFAPTQVPSTL
jgi:hypothetical protein